MPKKEIKKTKPVFTEVDFFYKTDYTATTVSNFEILYKKVYNKIPCLDCKKNPVDIKKEVFDSHIPLFGILRKKYCLSCWLKRVSLQHDQEQVK